MDLLPRVEIRPATPVRCAVIWLHGLGANGHDFEPVPASLGLTDELGIHWVFPHAPDRAVTINGGMRMPAWYDIVDIGNRARQDEAGIRDSERDVRALLNHEMEVEGVSPSRIVLAGFSQGGAIAAHTGLRFEEKLAGLMLLSTYLPLADKAESERLEANQKTPIFMAHGQYDMVLPLGLGKASQEKLSDWGYSVDWRAYPMDHAVCPQEIGDIGRFLQECLAV